MISVTNLFRWSPRVNTFPNQKMPGLLVAGAAFFGLGYLFYYLSRHRSPPQERKIIVITDLEPDDRVALDLIASHFSDKNIMLVGTTVMHAARKAALVRKQLNQLGLGSVPVFQGSGGVSDDYRAIYSTKAAKSYKREGQGILTAEELQRLDAAPRTSGELQQGIKKRLEIAADKSVEIVMLAPPTDLVKVFGDTPELQKKIKHIYIMGGWAKLSGEDGDSICRTSYNWDMDPESSAQLMEMSHLPMTLYSSHVIKRCFPGGSINGKNFPELIELMNKYREILPSLEDTAHAKKSWNNHVMETIPSLKPIIEPYADHQITPADPAVIVGMIDPKFKIKEKKVRIKIDLTDQTEKGCRVDIAEDPSSQISLVEELDLSVFKEQLLKAYSHLVRNYSRLNPN